MCASIYCGPQHNFGGGSRIWIDNLDEASGTLQYFKDYFEDPSIKKVFHNYSFDYHEIQNEGILVDGFAGDTMHMARLWEASRIGKGSYSLESLSEELYIRKKPYKEIFGKPHIKRDGTAGKIVDVPPVIVIFRYPLHSLIRIFNAILKHDKSGSSILHSMQKPHGMFERSWRIFFAKCIGLKRKSMDRREIWVCGTFISCITATSVSYWWTWKIEVFL